MTGRRYRRKPTNRNGMRRLSGHSNTHLDSSPFEFEAIYEVEHFYLRESLGERIDRLSHDVKLDPVHLLQVLLLEGLTKLEKLPRQEVRQYLKQTVNFKELLP